MPENIEDKDIVKYIMRDFKEAESAKQSREERDRANMDAYFGRSDKLASKKSRGQSHEFLPLTSTSVDMMSAFLEKATTDYGMWFDIELKNENILSAERVRQLISHFLHCANFTTILGDVIKYALLKSVGVFKVHSKHENKRIPVRDNNGNITFKYIPKFHPIIEAIDPSDYYPDPTGRELYQIHRIEKDLYEIKQNPIYDQDIVSQIEGRLSSSNTARRYDKYQQINQDTPESERKTVYLLEFIGTLIDNNGNVIYQDVVATVEETTETLLRRPVSNPYIHNRSPIVEMPLLRVSGSKWHKALQDDAVKLNNTMNELYNLMLDSGLLSVHGIKQIYKDNIDNIEDFVDGIPPGANLYATSSTPFGADLIKNVFIGNVPPDAMAMFNLMNQFHQTITLINDIKQGILPPRAVKATEIVESIQQSSVGIDKIAKRVEAAVTDVLKLLFFVILQGLTQNDLFDKEVSNILGIDAVSRFAAMSPTERYLEFYDCNIRVSGFSAVISRVKDYQKLLAYLDIITKLPSLFEDFSKRFSPQKLNDFIISSLNIDPIRLKFDQQELLAIQEAERREAVLGAKLFGPGVDIAGAEVVENNAGGNGSRSEALKGMLRDAFTDDTLPAGKGSLRGRV